MKYEFNSGEFDISKFADFYFVKMLIVNRVDYSSSINSYILSNFLQRELYTDLVSVEVKDDVETIYHILDFLISESNITKKSKNILEYFYLGYSPKEVSEITGIKSETVKKSVNRTVYKINKTATEYFLKED